MNARKTIVWAMGLFITLGSLVSGCYIEHDGNIDWHDGEFVGGNAGICDVFCETLVDCGTLAPKQQDACLDECNAKHTLVPYTTEQGALCVLEQDCREIDAYACPGAPFPNANVSSSNNLTACSANCDCPSGDVCTGGYCKTPCGASCDCNAQEICNAGYCELPAEPSVACAADCDCPSGEVCLEGICSAS